MPAPTRQIRPTSDPRFDIEWTDDGSRTLIRTRDQVRFHSGSGARSECEHVYLSGSRILEPCVSTPSRLLEVGFGTGMNMLRTVDAFLSRQECTGRTLEYIALENDPIPAAVLESLELERELVRGQLAADFLTWWRRSNLGSWQSVSWSPDPRCSVTVHQTNAVHWISNAVGRLATFDAVYFDPFDPQSDEALWDTEVMRNLHGLLRPGGRLVTYCVKSQIRKRLVAVGFEAKRVPGPPGGKREVLVAIRKP